MVTLCYITWADGHRSYTSSTVIEKSEALYGPLMTGVVTRTEHVFMRHSDGTAFVSADVAATEKKT